MTSASSIQSLTFSNCVFKNFIYDFNTFIELNSWGGTVSISSTTFDRMSNCGSILRNYKSFLGNTTFNNAYNWYYNQGQDNNVEYTSLEEIQTI